LTETFETVYWQVHSRR